MVDEEVGAAHPASCLHIKLDTDHCAQDLLSLGKLFSLQCDGA